MTHVNMNAYVSCVHMKACVTYKYGYECACDIIHNTYEYECVCHMIHVDKKAYVTYEYG